jgi:hypothetical protein
MIESGPIESKELASSFAFDGGSSWSIVHEGQLTKEISSFIGL